MFLCRFRTSNWIPSTAVTLRALNSSENDLTSSNLWNFFLFRFATHKTTKLLLSWIKTKQKNYLVTIMARQNLRNLLLIASLVFIAFLSELPRQHVEARTLKKREAELMTFGNITTPEAISTTAEAQPILIIVLTTPESIRNTTALEINSSSESLSASTESQRWIHRHWVTFSFIIRAENLRLCSKDACSCDVKRLNDCFLC